MTLSPASRALLDLAREGLSPDTSTLRRVRGKIDTAVGAGAAVGGSLALKLSIATIAAVIAGAIAMQPDEATMPMLHLGSSSSMIESPEARVHEAAPPIHVEMPAEPAHVETVEQPPEPAHVEQPRLDRTRIARSEPSRADRIEPSRVEPSRVDSRGEPSRVEPSRVEPSRANPITLAREVELVDAAMASLRKGDGENALVSVRLHREETRGKGQLAEDAAAIEIEALCKLRDRRVVAKLEAFDARWPESAQRSRLTTNCP